MIFNLSIEQYKLLQDELDEELRPFVKFYDIEQNVPTVDIDIDNVDEIRDWVSDKLQSDGFDVDYNPTPYGELLEQLIDIFYVDE